MRKISSTQIEKVISDLALKANFTLRKDVLGALKKAYVLEKKPVAKKALTPKCPFTQ